MIVNAVVLTIHVGLGKEIVTKTMNALEIWFVEETIVAWNTKVLQLIVVNLEVTKYMKIQYTRVKEKCIQRKV